MRILVTGANGYLGRGIVNELVKHSVKVIATDYTTEGVNSHAEHVQCNLFDIEDPHVFFDKPDALLHLAWRDGFVHYSDAHIADLPKHFQFIKKMSETEIKRIAVMGSMHEIGFYEGSIKEDTPCNPVTPYGVAKNALRELTSMLCEQNNVLFQWLRGFYIVGNSSYGSSIFSKLTGAAEEGKRKFPFTQGLNQFDFIDYDDFCYRTAAAVSQDRINGVINICSGRPEKLADRVERFIIENNYNIELEYGAFPDRPYDSKAVWGDNTKILSILSKV